jgi:phosphoglycolate phosphatase
MFQVKKYLRNEVKHLEPSVDIFSTLQALREGDNTLSILTSNSLENVELWLKKQKMRHFFAYIKAESAFFSKKKSLRQFIKLLKLNPAETFYIGDETRDIEAAKGNQLISIAVSWGFNSEKALIKAKPDYIIHRPQELLMIVKNRSNVEMS